MIKRIFLVLLLCCFNMQPDAFGEYRNALVIGNANYKSAPLKNPVNDARDVAAILETSGFNVTLLMNADRREMDMAVREFGKKLLKASGTGLFYFAGHGIQLEGRNYLIPIGAFIESESDVQFESLDAGRVLGKMEDAGNKMNIIILDACRNNPFGRGFRSSSMGLAQMDAPSGSIIAYATAPGRLAADGEGQNGMYTKHLVDQIGKPGITVEEMFRNVRVAVVKESESRQVPWESSSMMGKFFFNPQPVKDQVTPKKGNPLPAGAGSEELLFWESVRNATDAKMYQAYVDNFPDGVFTDLAKIKIRDLEASSSISPASQATDKSDIVSKDAYWEQLPEEKTAMTQRFIKDENGIVHDRKTDLQWVEGPAEKLLWREAKNWVDNLELDGGGWRLPGKAELESLYKNGAGPRNMPPILSTTAWEVFSDDSQSEQWQWIFFFKKGYGNNSGPMDECRVFAVRSRE